MKRKSIRNRKILFFLLGLALIGSIAGSIFLVVIQSSDKELVKEYITSFMESITEQKLNYMDVLKNSIFSNLLYSFLMFILGISIIGIFVILLLYFMKSFMIGFSISSFVFTYGIKGILFSILYLIPHFLNFIFYTILVVFCIKISSLFLMSLFKKEEVSFKGPFEKYLTFYFVMIFFLLLSSLIETFLVPFFIAAFHI
jgi:stage II sporulation protein M